MEVFHITEDNFEKDVLQSEVPVVVDFWAEWCGPCKAMSPILDELNSELDGKAKIAKLNVDEAQNIAAKYKIMSIPTLLIFKKGEVVEQLVGVMPKDQILSKINTLL